MKISIAQDLQRLAALSFLFSRVERITRHEDGQRPETDSDHTVMLGLVACSYAATYAPHLDVGLIARYCLVHDLVEAHSGDVNSMGMSDRVAAAKEERERVALEKIRAGFVSLPWLAETIDEYEELKTEEARFVKIMDKVLPKLTHLLNGGAALAEHGFSYEQAHKDHIAQRARMFKEYPQIDALIVFDAVIDECAFAWGLK